MSITSDSSNGHNCMFEINCGANTDPPSDKDKTDDLVMRLIQPYLNVGRCLYIDNYYTSLTVSQKVVQEHFSREAHFFFCFR